MSGVMSGVMSDVMPGTAPRPEQRKALQRGAASTASPCRPPAHRATRQQVPDDDGGRRGPEGYARRPQGWRNSLPATDKSSGELCGRLRRVQYPARGAVEVRTWEGKHNKTGTRRPGALEGRPPRGKRRDATRRDTTRRTCRGAAWLPARLAACPPGLPRPAPSRHACSTELCRRASELRPSTEPLASPSRLPKIDQLFFHYRFWGVRLARGTRERDRWLAGGRAGATSGAAARCTVWRRGRGVAGRARAARAPGVAWGGGGGGSAAVVGRHRPGWGPVAVGRHEALCGVAWRCEGDRPEGVAPASPLSIGNVEYNIDSTALALCCVLCWCSVVSTWMRWEAHRYTLQHPGNQHSLPS